MLKDLMQREVTRKEFLIYAGIGIATILGFANIVRLVTGNPDAMRLPVQDTAVVPYGGKK